MKRAVWFTLGLVLGLAVALGALGFTFARQWGAMPTASTSAIAKQFDLKIVWTDKDACGRGEIQGGCFLPSTPAVIYVTRKMDTQTTFNVTLHEIGHAMQYRLGQPLDECKADAFALSMGATEGYYHCS